MVLIKLSAHCKKIVMGMVILLIVICFLLAFTQSNKGETNKSDVTSVATLESVSEIETTTSVGETELDVELETVEERVYIQYYTEQDAIDIAKVLYRECRGVGSVTEQACVAWTILNRVDYNNSSIYSVIRSPNQFAFSIGTPVWGNLLELANDVLERWSREKNGETNVGRVLPAEYRYFEGRNGHNYFRDAYEGDYNIWDYSLESPYKN